jgi:hypothetical protein
MNLVIGDDVTAAACETGGHWSRGLDGTLRTQTNARTTREGGPSSGSGVVGEHMSRRGNRILALVRETLVAPEMVAIGLGWGGGWPWH